MSEMTAGFPFPVQKKGKKNYTTVKPGFKERLYNEQLGNSELFSLSLNPTMTAGFPFPMHQKKTILKSNLCLRDG